ncbi:hypothetical protein [Streptomyces clavifer]|uniref:hypothetical protein n=1 Tax=Streptomyces clavifer TaxID=68188 RepID=UPI003090B5C7|nr:hypothetical protein OG388_26780 [Streptomyces clavifer]
MTTDTDPLAELRQTAVRAIHALKSPPPPGSQHYQSGWGTGLEAAIEAVQAVFDQAPATVARRILGTTEQADTVAAPTDRRERYAAAIRDTDGRVLDDGQHMLNAVMAVADAEQAALRAEAEGLDEALRGAITVSEKENNRLRADRAAALNEAADYAQQVAKAMATADEDWASRAGWACASVATGLRRLAAEAQQPTPAPAEEPAPAGELPVVAYRNTDRPGVLLCRWHGEGWVGLTPLTSEDLEDGGVCTWGGCGRDVLIDPAPAEETKPEAPVSPTAVLLAARCDGCPHPLDSHLRYGACLADGCTCHRYQPAP